MLFFILNSTVLTLSRQIEAVVPIPAVAVGQALCFQNLRLLGIDPGGLFVSCKFGCWSAAVKTPKLPYLKEGQERLRKAGLNMHGMDNSHQHANDCL